MLIAFHFHFVSSFAHLFIFVCWAKITIFISNLFYVESDAVKIRNFCKKLNGGILGSEIIFSIRSAVLTQYGSVTGGQTDRLTFCD